MRCPTLLFSPAETAACKRLIDLALDEDLGAGEGGTRRSDVTSQAVIPANLQGQASFIARASGVLSGMCAAKLVLHAVDNSLRLDTIRQDGGDVRAGDRLAIVSGSMRGILAAERTALNFLQHLSGIATLTRRYVDAVAGLNCRILDTRKTLPGWRLLEKYAVRCGGGHNHRMGLFDGILIKDNHLGALRLADCGLRMADLIRRAREAAPGLPVEIEVDSLDLFDKVLVCGPDIILLDNMGVTQLRQAVA